MRKLSLIAMLVVGLWLAIPWPAQAEAVEVHIGASLSNMIWQHSPSAFAPSTTWSDLGIARAFDRVLVDLRVAFWDFQTMQINDPLSFVLDISTEVAQWSGAGVEINGGATISPAPLWVGLHIGARVRAVLYSDLVVTSGVFLAGTQGVRNEFPSGWAVGIKLGVLWSWPLPISL